METSEIHAFPDGHRIGLAITNSMAVIEALLGKPSEFVRTPKYRVELKKAAGSGRSTSGTARGWKPYVELGLAAYFLFSTAYSLTRGKLPDRALPDAILCRLLLHGIDVPFPNPTSAALELVARPRSSATSLAGDIGWRGAGDTVAACAPSSAALARSTRRSGERPPR